MKPWPRLFLAPVAVCLFLGAVLATDAPEQDLADYRTVQKAITTKLAKSDVTTVSTQPYLGVEVGVDAQGQVIVNEVATQSPAAAGGLQRSDVLVKIDGTAVKDDAAFRELLSKKFPGQAVALIVSRDGKQLELSPTLGTLSRPYAHGRQQAVLGALVVKAKNGVGVIVEQVTPDSPAHKADLKVGDFIMMVDGKTVPAPDKLAEMIAAKKPGDTITLSLPAGDKKVVLAAEQISDKKGTSWDTRLAGTAWKKPVFRLAVICIEYPDQKHNSKVTSKDWEASLFSKGTYTKTSATGQQVYGSVNDFWQELSYGKLRVEGKCFDFVEVSKKRTDYATGNKQVLYTEAVDKLLAREGKDALSNFEGVFFLYAGTLPPGTKRGGGSLYWPHRSSFTHNGKRWPYFIVGEGGDRMANISVFAHEFGHMLNLPDLYARPEQPNIVGLWQWCVMSNQVGNGRPQHASAWCKERLGWIEPAVVDPTVKQKLILSPIIDSNKECYKILIHRDGSEYLLLENRIKKGFDKSVPGEGLLIWRVVNGQPILEESHGVEGPSAPSFSPTNVPYPSSANDSFTPFTVPSSRSKLGGGLPVYITNIRRLSDGRITFHIGYEYQ
jgi:M6 family metalloprotease-like protein